MPPINAIGTLRIIRRAFLIEPKAKANIRKTTPITIGTII